MQYEQFPHYWVNHLGFLIRKQLAQDFARAGHQVTAEEWAVLLVLQAEWGPNPVGLTSTELSDRTMRDKTTVTRMIDRMVAKEMVVRQPDADDRRIQRLHLTAPGLALFDELSVLARALIARSVGGIASDDLDTTVSTLSRMTDNLLSGPAQEATNGL